MRVEARRKAHFPDRNETRQQASSTKWNETWANNFVLRNEPSKCRPIYRNIVTEHLYFKVNLDAQFTESLKQRNQHFVILLPFFEIRNTMTLPVMVSVSTKDERIPILKIMVNMITIRYINNCSTIKTDNDFQIL